VRGATDKSTDYVWKGKVAETMNRWLLIIIG